MGDILRLTNRVRRASVDDDVDMTPMVDMTFLLLIFFMATAAFSLQKTLAAPPPDSNEAAENRSVDDFESDDDFVVIRITPESTYWVDEREAASDQEMLVQLRETRRRRPGSNRLPTRLLVLAAPEARHDKVVFALDAGAEVGLEDVRLATHEEPF